MTPRPYTDRGKLDDGNGVRKACRFDKEWLKDCSGTKDDKFGFKDGKPCIIVKLNRIVNFKPRVSYPTFWFKIMPSILTYLFAIYASCLQTIFVSPRQHLALYYWFLNGLLIFSSLYIIVCCVALWSALFRA